MGWWSTTIMGGDDPLDGEGFIMDFIGVEFNYGEGESYDPAKAKEGLEFQQKEFLIEIDKHVKNGSFYESNYIYKQVLGVLLMRYGCIIQDEVKDEVIQAATKDGWAQEDKERLGHINAFISAIESYTGNPTEVKQEGLFQKIVEHLQKDQD